ncbi:hypothetical protein [Streptacidiphilus albus]|uniref:hypothetical protein n=1 Tax=Streptacidiphilus albus TaxID=105425 RepID=UPI00128D7E9D|nr:hypothetical protein [Streptacidiphilus albus]
MSENEGTPRSLRLSLEFTVPRGLKANIRGTDIQKALDTMADRIIGLAEALLPWADTVKVRKEWVYNWTDYTEEFPLAATDKNTVK